MTNTSTASKPVFAEGERVLCYEPDRTKVRVLYDAKILDVVENKEKKGRKTYGYLIHFNGWNRSWDRVVPEEEILPNTEESRQLKRKLDDKADLIAGRTHKISRKRAAGGAAVSQKADSLTCSEESSSEEESSDEEEWARNVFLLEIPDTLKEIVDVEECSINQKGLLHSLPARTSALDIFEGFVAHTAYHWLCISGDEAVASSSTLATSASSSSKQQQQQQRRTSERRRQMRGKGRQEAVRRQIELTKETVDGLRIIMDYALERVLLYDKERLQFEKLSSLTTLVAADSTKSVGSTSNTKSSTSESVAPKSQSFLKRELEALLEDQKESNCGVSVDSTEKSPVVQARGRSMRISTLYNSIASGTLPRSCDMIVTPKIENSQEDDKSEQHAAYSESTISDDGATLDTVSAHAQSCSTNSVSPHGGGGSHVTERLLDSALAWKIVPEELRNKATPSAVYGAHHVLRLMVKVGEILSMMPMPQRKARVLEKFLNSFIRYLDEKRKELFIASSYTEASKAMARISQIEVCKKE